MVIKINYTSSDVYVSTSVSPVYVVVNYSGTSGGGGGVWGAITGTLSNQTDLQSALDGKFDDPTGDTTQYIAGDGSLVAFPISGQAGTIVREVRNVTGATLTKGTVVYINGASGNKPTVTKAIATSDATSAQTFGLIQADILNNSNGYIVAVGDLDGLNTSSFADGTQLYLSSTIAGGYTSTKQYAPNHLVYIGVVTRSHINQGRIEVRIQNGYEMDELHNVSAQTPSNNDGLFYNTSTSLWETKQIGTALGYTPVPTTRTLTINGTAYDLSADRSWTVSASATPAGSNTQIQYNNSGVFGASAGLTYNDSTGSMTLTKNQSSDTSFAIINQSSRAYFSCQVDNGVFLHAKTPIGYTAYKILSGGDGYLYNSSTGDITLLNDNASGKIKFGAGGTSTAQMTLTAAGRLLLGLTSESTYLLDVNGTARVGATFTISASNGIPAATTDVLNIASGFTTPDIGRIYVGDGTGWRLHFSKRIASVTTDLVSITDSGDLNVSGVFRETVTTNRQTASYTLALTDRGKLVEMNVATANNLTVPLNSSIAFPIGSKIDLSQYGAGQTTVVATGGVTIRSAGGALKLAAQYSGASLVKIGTDEWYLFGNITV